MNRVHKNKLQICVPQLSGLGLVYGIVIEARCLCVIVLTLYTAVAPCSSLPQSTSFYCYGSMLYMVEAGQASYLLIVRYQLFLIPNNSSHMSLDLVLRQASWAYSMHPCLYWNLLSTVEFIVWTHLVSLSLSPSSIYWYTQTEVGTTVVTIKRIHYLPKPAGVPLLGCFSSNPPRITLISWFEAIINFVLMSAHDSPRIPCLVIACRIV